MSADLVTLLTQLQLSGAAAVVHDWLDRAAIEELSYADVLQGVLEEELAVPTAAATERRLRAAGFPFAASIEQFDFRFRPPVAPPHRSACWQHGPVLRSGHRASRARRSPPLSPGSKPTGSRSSR